PLGVAFTESCVCTSEVKKVLGELVWCREFNEVPGLWNSYEGSVGSGESRDIVSGCFDRADKVLLTVYCKYGHFEDTFPHCEGERREIMVESREAGLHALVDLLNIRHSQCGNEHHCRIHYAVVIACSRSAKPLGDFAMNQSLLGILSAWIATDLF